jgi:hypothetical protein
MEIELKLLLKMAENKENKSCWRLDVLGREREVSDSN